MKIYDRRSGEYLNVEQYGSGKLQFLYDNAFGRMLLWLAVSPLVSGIYGRINSLPSSAKKIPAFVNEYGIDTEEFELREYRSFNDFFTRRIRPGRRPIEDDPKAFISPADSKVLVYPIDVDTKLIIKGREYTLDEIFTYLEKADKPCIVAIDEFQQITKYQERNIEALLRGRIQKLVNTHFIFAGSERRMMNEMFFSNKRPFFQSATLLQLEPIDLTVYTDFAVQQFKTANKNIEPEAIEWAYSAFDGVTMYIHKLLHDTFAETLSGSTCTLTVMQQAAEQLLQQNAKRLQELLAYVTEQQKELLYAIAADRYVQRITSSDFVKRHHLKSASAVQSAVKRLLGLELITEQHKSFSISDPLLRIWINR